MHEQSETIKRNGKWVNVYGKATPKAGQPLPKKHFFEKEEYPTVKKAVHAARKRSQIEGKRSIFDPSFSGKRAKPPKR